MRTHTSLGIITTLDLVRLTVITSLHTTPMHGFLFPSSPHSRTPLGSYCELGWAAWPLQTSVHPTLPI